MEKLKSYGYNATAKEVKWIKVSRNSDEWKENLNVELTVDVIKNLENFDALVLLSGDSDFAQLLDTIKRSGKLAIVMSTKGHVSKEFRTYAFQIISGKNPSGQGPLLCYFPAVLLDVETLPRKIRQICLEFGQARKS